MNFDIQNVIDLLLTDFFPDEPCAAGLDLCPPGYRIPALEQDFKNIMSRGWSFLAEDMVNIRINVCHMDHEVILLKDKVVGVVICDVENKDEKQEEPVGIFPEQFLKLERFFTDLKSNIDLFEEVKMLSFLEDISQYNAFSARFNLGHLHSLFQIMSPRPRHRRATGFVFTEKIALTTTLVFNVSQLGRRLTLLAARASTRPTASA